MTHPLNTPIRTGKMVEDAYWMSLKKFIDTWGISQARVWSDVRSRAEQVYVQNQQAKKQSV